VQSLGTNLISVYPGREEGASGQRARRLTDVFTLEEVELIRQKATAVSQVAPMVSTSLLLQHDDQNDNVSVYGVTPEYEDTLNFHVAQGRFITTRDLDMYRKVMVLGQGIAEELFGSQDPVGQAVMASTTSGQRYQFLVVGLMEEKGEVMFFNYDDQAYIPLTTAQRRILNTDYIASLSIQARDAQSSQQAVEQIDALLYQRLGDETKYEIRSQEELLSTLGNITGVLQLMLVSIAGVSLLVGGIGIMNIMLVSVTERTREIGIRMAVGATRRDILLQFLWESVILCLIGGVMGVVAGWLGSKAIILFAGRLMPNMGLLSIQSAVISPQAVGLALGFATAVGLFFGVYPANKASKLDPVQALQYE